MQSRNVWHITSGEKGKTHTILTCVSAAGFVLPPFLIYPRKRITESLKELLLELYLTVVILGG